RSFSRPLAMARKSQTICFHEPVWSKNSSELFYRANEAIMSVRFKIAGAEFIPEKLLPFRQPVLVGGTSVRPTYAVVPAGRFLFNLPIPETGDERKQTNLSLYIALVQNWTEDVRRLLQSK